MGCGEFLVKYVLFFANLAFALAGLALLGLGLAVHLQFADIETVLSETSFRVAPVACMIVGGIAFIIAFFGCCGAIRESNCMLVTYAIFMLVLMALKLTLGVMVFVNLDGVVAAIPNWMNKTFQQDQDTFHVIEHRFSCCGPTGPGSYLSLTLPITCCSTTPCTVINAYAGCTEVLQALFNNYGVAIGSVAIVIAAIEGQNSNQQNQSGQQSQAPSGLFSGVQNFPFNFLNLLQPNRPGAQSTEKPAEATSTNGAASAAPDIAKPSESNLPTETKPEQPAAGPLKQIFENSPVLQGIAGAVKKIQTTVNNPVKPRDSEVVEETKSDQEKGGVILLPVHGHGGHGGNGGDNNNVSDGLKAEAEEIKVSTEEKQEEIKEKEIIVENKTE